MQSSATFASLGVRRATEYNAGCIRYLRSKTQSEAVKQNILFFETMTAHYLENAEIFFSDPENSFDCESLRRFLTSKTVKINGYDCCFLGMVVEEYGSHIAYFAYGDFFPLNLFYKWPVPKKKYFEDASEPLFLSYQGIFNENTLIYWMIDGLKSRWREAGGWFNVLVSTLGDVKKNYLSINLSDNIATSISVLSNVWLDEVLVTDLEYLDRDSADTFFRMNTRKLVCKNNRFLGIYLNKRPHKTTLKFKFFESIVSRARGLCILELVDFTFVISSDLARISRENMVNFYFYLEVEEPGNVDDFVQGDFEVERFFNADMGRIETVIPPQIRNKTLMYGVNIETSTPENSEHYRNLNIYLGPNSFENFQKNAKIITTGYFN